MWLSISNSYQQMTLTTLATSLKTAAQKDFDIYNGGWSADYLDPSSYLDILNVNNGGMLQNIGLEPGEVNDKAKAVGLDTYTPNARRSEQGARTSKTL